MRVYNVEQHINAQMMGPIDKILEVIWLAVATVNFELSYTHISNRPINLLAAKKLVT